MNPCSMPSRPRESQLRSVRQIQDWQGGLTQGIREGFPQAGLVGDAERCPDVRGQHVETCDHDPGHAMRGKGPGELRRGYFQTAAGVQG
jgi:hypothetical protein